MRFTSQDAERGAETYYLRKKAINRKIIILSRDIALCYFFIPGTNF